MKKYILLISIALGLSFSGLSQDTLYFNNGDKLAVDIVNTDQIQVKYKAPGSNLAKIQSAPISEIDKIVYSSGFVKEFKKEQSKARVPLYELDPIADDFGRHFIAINVFDAVFGPITISYEHVFQSGDYSLLVPISIGTGKGNDNLNHLDARKVYSTGIDVNVYPAKQGTSSFFFGPSIEFGKLDIDDEYSFYARENENYRAFLMNIGSLYQLSRHFNMSFKGGFGYMDQEFADTQFILRAGFLVGYKF